MSKTLLMGPLSPPYTGQSIAFSSIANQFVSDKNSIIINISNKDNVWLGVLLCFKIVFTVLFNKIHVIYFTCSRSFSGSIRDIVLLLCARIKKVRVINHLHGNTFYDFYHSSYSWYRPIIKYCYDWVDTSIVLLPKMMSQFKDFPKMKIEVIANSYSSELDNLPKEKVYKKDSSLELVYLSNIMESKGVINLLKACGGVFENNSQITLTIAGDYIGDYLCSKSQIKQKFDFLFNELKLKYPNQINYLGIVKGEKKERLLWNADVFILPTYHPSEAFPISIIEAMRAGNFIISTNHNLLPDVVSQGNGLLITPNSVDAIINVIENVASLNRENLCVVQNYNIQHAIKNYQEQKYVGQVLLIIKE